MQEENPSKITDPVFTECENMACSKLALRKKPEVDSENRVFKNEWTDKYNLVRIHNLQRIVNNASVECHYDTKHVNYLKALQHGLLTSYLTDVNAINKTLSEIMPADGAFHRKLEVFKCDIQEGLLHSPKHNAGKHDQVNPGHAD